jgi:hypothetical protein
MVAARLQNQIQHDYPETPLVKVVIGDEIREQANPLDPDYLAAVKTWQVERSQILMVYVWTAGISDVVPDVDMERLALVLGGSVSEIKYAWVMECVGNDPNDWGALTTAILGQTFVTSPGVEASMEAFRSNGGDSPVASIQPESGIDADHLQSGIRARTRATGIRSHQNGV